MNIQNYFSISIQKSLFLAKLTLIVLLIAQLQGCGAPAKGLLFSDYKSSLQTKENEATIIVYREYAAGGFGIPISLNGEDAGLLLPKGYLSLTVPSYKEHILNTKDEEEGVVDYKIDIKTAVTLNPGEIEYLKWKLLNIPFAPARSELAKVPEEVALKELKKSRNSEE